MDVDEEAVFLLGGIQTQHVVLQHWVGVEEVGMGDEDRRVWREERNLKTARI